MWPQGKRKKKILAPSGNQNLVVQPAAVYRGQVAAYKLTNICKA
jgi:hypothetical protein